MVEFATCNNIVINAAVFEDKILFKGNKCILLLQAKITKGCIHHLMIAQMSTEMSTCQLL